jgi:hypothetical protein
MGHPKRQAFIDELLPKLPGAELVLDREDNRWETGRRALLAFDSAASHHLVLQDDAIPSRDLLAAAENAAQAAGERPVSLYMGSVPQSRQIVVPAVREARESGTPWIEMEGPIWGVGIIVPTSHIPELVPWCDQRRLPNYDHRIASFYKNVVKTLCWYTAPSLVDHRPVGENPSLIEGRDGNRRAHWFIGEDNSGESLSWHQPPVDASPIVNFYNRKSRQRRRVRRGSHRHRALTDASNWEVT